MATLMINDLPQSTELDRAAMAEVHGGQGLFELMNMVTDFNFAQGFDLSTTASNLSVIEAIQGNTNGNGLQFAPQLIFVTQAADANTESAGNTTVA